MEEDENVLNLQHPEDEGQEQIITTNDGDYFINTIEITEDELNEQVVELGNVDENSLLQANQDYQIQIIGTDSDLSQLKIDSVGNRVNNNGNIESANNNSVDDSTNANTDDNSNNCNTYRLEDFTGENYQEVIIINAEDLEVESPTDDVGNSNSSPLEAFELHDNSSNSHHIKLSPKYSEKPTNGKTSFLVGNTTIKTTTMMTPTTATAAKERFILPNQNSQQDFAQTQNFILTSLEGKTYQISSSNQLIQLPSTSSAAAASIISTGNSNTNNGDSDIPFTITSSGNIVSHLATTSSGQQYIIPSDLTNTNFQIISVPSIQLNSQQEVDDKDFGASIASHLQQLQQQKHVDKKINNRSNANISTEKVVVDDEDLTFKMKSKPIICYPRAKPKLKKEQQSKPLPTLAASPSQSNNNSSILPLPKNDADGRILQDVNNDNNQDEVLAFEAFDQTEEIGEQEQEVGENYEVIGEDEREQEEDEEDVDDDDEIEEDVITEENIINQSSKTVSNSNGNMNSNNNTINTSSSLQTPVSSSPSVSFVMGRVSDSISTCANTISVSIPGTGLVCQLQRFMYTEGLCRVCLLVKTDMMSIFEDVSIASNGLIENSRGPHAAHKYNIIPALKTLLDIDISYGDGLPDKICSECMDNLMSFSVFRKKISIGQTKLNEILNQVKGSLNPTVIPEMGEKDMKRTDVYRHTDGIVQAKDLMKNSPYSHFVSRSMSDRVLEKILMKISQMVGFKSGKLKSLEQYALEPPYVTSWFCHPCNITIHGSKEVFAQHNIDAHNVKTASDVLYPCDLCGQSFTLEDSSGISQNYGEHWLQHLFFYECTECNRKMPSQKGLWVHKRSAHSEPNKIFQCNVTDCDKSFTKKAHLDAHKKVHLKPEERNLNYCNICGKGLTSSLAAHMNTVHKNERKWKCEICSKSFKRKEILNGHREQVHLNLKKYICGICGAELKSHSTKALHELRHSGESQKKFVCEHEGCTKKFYSSQSMKSHMLKHQETGDVACKVCNKTFKRKIYLNEHMRIHTKQYPFSCPICFKRIRMKSNYFKHLKVHSKRNETIPDNGNPTKEDDVAAIQVCIIPS